MKDREERVKVRWNIIQLNKFAGLHNGNSVFFCKTDYLLHLFTDLNNHYVPSVLISGNSDYSITDEIASLAPTCIKKWYAQNAETKNSLVTGIPMGIENHKDCILKNHGVGWSHAEEKVEILSQPPMVSASKDIYANFSLDTHSSRIEVYELCKDLNFITTDVSTCHSQINKKSFGK